MRQAYLPQRQLLSQKTKVALPVGTGRNRKKFKRLRNKLMMMVPELPIYEKIRPNNLWIVILSLHRQFT